MYSKYLIVMTSHVSNMLLWVILLTALNPATFIYGAKTIYTQSLTTPGRSNYLYRQQYSIGSNYRNGPQFVRGNIDGVQSPSTLLSVQSKPLLSPAGSTIEAEANTPTTANSAGSKANADGLLRMDTAESTNVVHKFKIQFKPQQISTPVSSPMSNLQLNGDARNHRRRNLHNSNTNSNNSQNNNNVNDHESEQIALLRNAAAAVAVSQPTIMTYRTHHRYNNLIDHHHHHNLINHGLSSPATVTVDEIVEIADDTNANNDFNENNFQHSKNNTAEFVQLGGNDDEVINDKLLTSDNLHLSDNDNGKPVDNDEGTNKNKNSMDNESNDNRRIFKRKNLPNGAANADDNDDDNADDLNNVRTNADIQRIMPSTIIDFDSTSATPNSNTNTVTVTGKLSTNVNKSKSQNKSSKLNHRRKLSQLQFATTSNSNGNNNNEPMFYKFNNNHTIQNIVIPLPAHRLNDRSLATGVIVISQDHGFPGNFLAAPKTYHHHHHHHHSMPSTSTVSEHRGQYQPYTYDIARHYHYELLTSNNNNLDPENTAKSNTESINHFNVPLSENNSNNKLSSEEEEINGNDENESFEKELMNENIFNNKKDSEKDKKEFLKLNSGSSLPKRSPVLKSTTVETTSTLEPEKVTTTTPNSNLDDLERITTITTTTMLPFSEQLTTTTIAPQTTTTTLSTIATPPQELAATLNKNIEPELTPAKQRDSNPVTLIKKSNKKRKDGAQQQLKGKNSSKNFDIQRISKQQLAATSPQQTNTDNNSFVLKRKVKQVVTTSAPEAKLQSATSNNEQSQSTQARSASIHNAQVLNSLVKELSQAIENRMRELENMTESTKSLSANTTTSSATAVPVVTTLSPETTTNLPESENESNLATTVVSEPEQTTIISSTVPPVITTNSIYDNIDLTTTSKEISEDDDDDSNEGDCMDQEQPEKDSELEKNDEIVPTANQPNLNANIDKETESIERFKKDSKDMKDDETNSEVNVSEGNASLLKNQETSSVVTATTLMALDGLSTTIVTTTPVPETQKKSGSSEEEDEEVIINRSKTEVQNKMSNGENVLDETTTTIKAITTTSTESPSDAGVSGPKNVRSVGKASGKTRQVSAQTKTESKPEKNETKNRQKTSRPEESSTKSGSIKSNPLVMGKAGEQKFLKLQSPMERRNEETNKLKNQWNQWKPQLIESIDDNDDETEDDEEDEEDFVIQGDRVFMRRPPGNPKIPNNFGFSNVVVDEQPNFGKENSEKENANSKNSSNSNAQNKQLKESSDDELKSTGKRNEETRRKIYIAKYEVVDTTTRLPRINDKFTKINFSNDYDEEDNNNGDEDDNDMGEANVPGVPGIDYPVFGNIPDTSFECSKQQYPGFYADMETGCQVYHSCSLTSILKRKYDIEHLPGSSFLDQELASDSSSIPLLTASTLPSGTLTAQESKIKLSKLMVPKQSRKTSELVDGKHSFLCPNGTIFSQEYLICDWWYNVKCEESPRFYPLNRDVFASGLQLSDNLQRPTNNQSQQQKDQRLKESSSVIYPILYHQRIKK